MSKETGNQTFQIQAQLLEAHCWLHLGEYTRSSVIGQEVAGLAQALPKDTDVHRTLNLVLSSVAMIKGDMKEACRCLHDSDWLAWLGIAAALDGDLMTAQALMVQVVNWAIEYRNAHLLAISLTLAAYQHTLKRRPRTRDCALCPCPTAPLCRQLKLV